MSPQVIIMKFSTLYSFVTVLHYVIAAQSWAGSNLYYAAGLTTAQQNTLFTALQASGITVLRVWLDGKSLTLIHELPLMI